MIAIAFPEDDRLKDALLLAEKYRDEIQANVTFESQVAEKLAAAVGYMDRCESKMRKALKYSTKLHYGSFHSTFFLVSCWSSGLIVRKCYVCLPEWHTSWFELIYFYFYMTVPGLYLDLHPKPS